MFDLTKIPPLYHTLRNQGRFDYDTGHALFLDNMEWMDYNDLLHYTPEEGMPENMLPFAFNSGGDHWMFVENGSSEPIIAICYHDTGDGQYYAKSFQDALFRSIIEYAANGMIAEEKDEPYFADHGRLMQEEFRAYCEIFAGLMPEAYLAEFAAISGMPLQKMEDSGYFRYAFISYDKADAIIQRHCNFIQLNQEFIWWNEEE